MGADVQNLRQMQESLAAAQNISRIPQNKIARGELEALRDADDVMMTNCLVMTRRIAGKLAGRPADRMVAMYPWISMSLMFLGRRGTRVASHLSTIQSLLQSKSGQGRSCRLTASHEAQNKPAIWRHWRGYKR
jgi:hypothetical protein